MAKDRKPVAAPRREVSEGKRKAVAIWTKAWGLIGAIIIVFIAAGLPDTLRAGGGAPLLRDVGLIVICLNLILQATRPTWPMV